MFSPPSLFHERHKQSYIVYLLTLFIQLYLYLIQNRLSLKLLTYRLCFGFFSSLSFMKMWNLTRFMHLWMKQFFGINISTPLHIFVIEKCSNSELWWTNTINFYTKNRRTSEQVRAQRLVFSIGDVKCLTSSLPVTELLSPRIFGSNMLVGLVN